MLGTRHIHISTVRLLSDSLSYAPIISYGDNSEREQRSGCNYGTHAETDAIRKLPPRKNRRVIPVDLVIIRVNRKGQLRNSKPCSNCIAHLYRLKGYRVKHIFYSTETTIVKVNLCDLMEESNPHQSKLFAFRHG